MDILSSLYTDEADIRRVATTAELDIRYISFTGKSINTWHSVLEETAKQQKIGTLLDVALMDYYANPQLQEVCRAYHESIAQGQNPGLAIQLQVALTGYAEWNLAQNQKFQHLLRSEITSRSAFRQVLNVADEQVKLVERQNLLSSLDLWFSNWRENKIFTLLGEEGDGKTWGIAAWLNQKISTDITFPPVVFLSSADALSNDPQELVLQAIEPHNILIPSNEWEQKAIQWFTQSVANVPTLILILDGINERRDFAWWRQLLETINGDEGYSNWAVIITCRIEYWQRTFSKLSSLQTASFTLQPYDDKELAQALELNGLKQSDLSAELLKFVRKPRYFDLAVTYRHRFGSDKNITVARLIYEDWRDKWSRKSNTLITDEEFRELLRQSAEKQKRRAISVRRQYFDELISIHSPNPLELLEELRTGRVIQVHEGRVQLDDRLLVMGLGLLLVDQLIDAYENDETDLIEVAAKWLEPNAGMDIKAQICEMAALHALSIPNISQKVKVTLLLIWLTNQNLSQEFETIFTAYMSDNIESYILLCEYVWSEDFDNRWAQELIISAFIYHYSRYQQIHNVLEGAIERWLGMVHIAGFPHQRVNESERTEEIKARIAQRVGFDLMPGNFTFAGRTLTAIDDDNLLRLGRAALAIISHFPRNQFVHSIATGCIAEAIMDRPDKYELFKWVLSTAPESVWLEVHHEVNRLLTFDSLVMQQAAHRLLSFEGSKQAYELQKSLPSDLFPVHPLSLEIEKDPTRFQFSWNKPACEISVHRTDLETQYIARGIQLYAPDPTLIVPEDTRQRFAVLAEAMSIDEIWSTMMTGIQDLTFEQYEPALCAFAPHAISNVVRQIVQLIPARADLALRQISFRLREHTLLFEKAEIQSIYQAWQQLYQPVPTLEEERKTAEMMLFALVLSNLNAEEQLEHLLQRPDDAGIDLIQYENYFLPIKDWAFVEGLLETITSEHGLPRLLWFISAHAGQIPNDFLLGRVMPYVESPYPQIRRLALRIIHNSQNRYLSFAVVGSWRWNPNNLEEENFLGSSILCEYGQFLSIENLCQRIDPSYLGYAVHYRGNNPLEVDFFAEKLHDLWQHVSKLTIDMSQNFPEATIDIDARPNQEKDNRPRLSILNKNQKHIQWRSSDQTWGGGKQNVPWRFAFPTEEEINEQHLHDTTTVQAIKEQEFSAGNPWFARRFQSYALEEVIINRPELLDQWLEAVSEQKSHRFRILQRCHSFYEALCIVLLKCSPEKGVNLYTQMAQVNILSRDARTRWQLVDRVLFCANPVDVIDELWKKKLQNCTTDAQLLMLASMLQWGSGKEWLWEYINQQLESVAPICISRGVTLLGYCNSDAAQDRLNQLYLAAPDTWMKQLLEKSIKRWNLNAWAKHWFTRIFSSETNIDAWSAFRLFLRCVDGRFWIWYAEIKEAYLESPNFEHHWQFIEINWETIRNKIRKNEDSFEKQLFGQKILQNQAWPWM